jgi:hypothetical protein
MSGKANFLSKLINTSLKFLIALVILSVLYLVEQYSKVMSYKDFLFAVFFIICGLALNYCIKKNVKTRTLIIVIVAFGFILRLAWIISINSVPVSDFGGMYMRSEYFLKGQYAMFKGHSYYARFPHLTITILYFALIRKFFTYSLFTLKFINVICSTSTIFICYLISKEVFNSKLKAIWTSYIAAIYPPILIYSAVYCSENMAIPFYMLSVYIFILVVKNKKTSWFLLLSALSLSVGNLFRMVGSVMIVAYIMYLIFYSREKLKEKILASSYILAGFLVPLVIVSNVLIFKGITEQQLWGGSEPKWTSILKGSNIKTYGRFNYDDSNIGDKYNNDYEKTSEAAKNLVIERLTKTPLNELGKFFFVKYTMQWAEGDFGAIYWSHSKLKASDITIDLRYSAHFYSQMFYLGIILLTYKGLFNKKQYLKNSIINLFYIIYCGYGLLYLITESQDRYSFIISWVFIILAFAALDEDKYFKTKTLSENENKAITEVPQL